MESEKRTEQYLRLQMQKIGGDAYKFSSPQRRGVPDRICIFPSGKVVFVEVKSEGLTMGAHQTREAEHLRKLGQIVHMVDTKAKVNELISTYGSL